MHLSLYPYTEDNYFDFETALASDLWSTLTEMISQDSEMRSKPFSHRNLTKKLGASGIKSILESTNEEILCMNGPRRVGSLFVPPKRVIIFDMEEGDDDENSDQGENENESGNEKENESEGEQNDDEQIEDAQEFEMDEESS